MVRQGIKFSKASGNPNITMLLFFFFCFSQVNTHQTSAYFAFFDGAYDITMNVSKSIPWKMFDRIIVSFTTITEQANMTNNHMSDHLKILHIISLYKKARPDGEIFVSLYGDSIDDRFVNAANHSDVFSRSVLEYLQKYNMTGLDIDWESRSINRYVNELITLIKSCNKVFKKKYKISHAIWPYVHAAETVGLLANQVDEINIMSYSLSTEFVELLINQYNASGFPYEKMVLGVETELGTETKNIIIGKVALMEKYNLRGIFLWRLDNDDIQLVDNSGKKIPTFKTTKMLYDALNNRLN